MAYTEPAGGAADAVTGVVAPASLWNTYVRDNLLASYLHLIVRKTADEPIASSTTHQSDDVLLAPVLANEVWFLEWILKFGGSSSGDLKTQWTFPTAGDLTASVVAADTGGTIVSQTLASTTSPVGDMTFACLGTTSYVIVRIPMIYINGGNAGNVQLQWAQFASNATATVMKANSTVWGKLLNP